MIELSGLKHHVRMEEAFSIGLAGHEKNQWKSWKEMWRGHDSMTYRNSEPLYL